MADRPSANQIRAHLSEVDYPAGKDALCAHAERSGAPEEVLAALRALPLADYANEDEVIRSAETL